MRIEDAVAESYSPTGDVVEVLVQSLQMTGEVQVVNLDEHPEICAYCDRTEGERDLKFHAPNECVECWEIGEGLRQTTSW